jgi:predicted NBD/HSP70 family sugar kinase
LQIGVDVGDPAVALLVDDGGTVVAREHADAGGDATAIAGAAARVARGAAGDGRVAVGIASPTPDGPHVAAIVTAMARAGLAADGRVVSAGTAAALAESWIGAAKGARDVVFFSVSDRTMGGIVRDGAPVSGVHGRGASVAWLALNPVEREDYRKVGCLEAEVSASGIVRRLIWRIKAGDRSRVQDDVADDFGAITIDHVLDAARDGDGVAISVVRDTAKYLGMAAANLVAVVDPEVLVLGGIMASSTDLLFDLVRTELGRRLPRAMVDALSTVPSALGGDAVAIGAARVAAIARP